MAYVCVCVLESAERLPIARSLNNLFSPYEVCAETHTAKQLNLYDWLNAYSALREKQTRKKTKII